jgi:hypothetical protein
VSKTTNTIAATRVRPLMARLSSLEAKEAIYTGVNPSTSIAISHCYVYTIHLPIV